MMALPAAAHASLQRIVAASGARRLLVACSGGRDSCVLLDLAVPFARKAGLAIEAVHVDHGLQPGSAGWARHAARIAAERDVVFHGLRLAGAPAPGDSIEAWARRERYAAMSALMSSATCLLTAHHADDQVETVLMRALAGAGPHGLRGMRELRAMAPGTLGRPLLACRGRDVAAYACARGLAFVDDPGNHDPRFLRNRLRHALLPRLQVHDPAIASRLLRLGAAEAALARALDAAADAWLQRSGSRLPVVSGDAVSAAGPVFGCYVLRRAAERAGLDPPAGRHLREMRDRLLPARADAAPLVSWGRNQVRRYRGHLYFMSAPPAVPDADEAFEWLPHTALALPWGELRPDGGAGPALSRRALARGPVTVTFRRGGERCRLHGRGHHQALKKLFQDWHVPPWERAITPLVRIDGVLAAIGAYGVCEGFGAEDEADATRLDWRPSLYGGGGA